MPTKRQTQVLEFVTRHQMAHGFPPTVREIQKHLDLKSTGGVAKHLQRLVEQGALVVERTGHARAYMAKVTRAALVNVPIFGTIPAGLPKAEALEPDEHVTVDARLLKVRPSTKVYGLQVKGDSMTGADIRDGDYVFVVQREPRHGEIVAALIDGATTLKRFIRERGKVLLKPENPNYPVLAPSEELVVQGVMVGQFRQHG